MMELSLAVQTGEGWVTVFPRGKHYINKYNLVLNCDDKFFGEINKWWNGSTFKKPYLDKNHEFGERYGEFTEMRINDEGLQMYLRLTDEGKELLKSGKYEYLSPTFNDAKDSEGRLYKNVVFTVSLVNYPALMVLDKVQQQIALSIEGDNKNNKGGKPMELREIVASKLSLSLAADDGSILAEIERLLNEGATIEDLKAEIQKMKDALAGAEAEKLKAVEEKEELSAKLSALEVEGKKAEAERVIDEAIELGQFLPALKELKMEQYLSSPESIKKELSVIPKTPAGRQKSSSGGQDHLELSAEDKAILEDAGYDLSKPEDMKLAKEFLMTQGGK